MNDLQQITNLLFEVGILSKTPRSGFHFLGSGQQSVSEHITRTIYAGYILSMMEKDINTDKVLKMCLLHDLAEARTSDLNYIHQKYVQRQEEKAVHDLAESLPFGEDILKTLEEYEQRKTPEALIAKDADNIEWIISLKEQADIGNTRALEWIPSAIKRLKTESAKKLADQIVKTNSDQWWFTNKQDEWWVSRGKEK